MKKFLCSLALVTLLATDIRACGLVARVRARFGRGFGFYIGRVEYVAPVADFAPQAVTPPTTCPTCPSAPAFFQEVVPQSCPNGTCPR